MRLASLHVRHLPGLDRPFQFDPGDGINLLIGPNAAGKSSVARAVRDLLWPEKRESEIAWLRAVFRTDAADWTVTCDGGATAWLREGQPAPAPSLPPAHLADCYRLAAPDLLGGHGPYDRDLAQAIRTEMTGGYDLDGLAATLPDPSRRKARPLTQALLSAREEVARIDRAQQALADRRAGEADLEARAAAAEAAGRRLTALEAHRACLEAGQTRDDAEAALEHFPSAVEKVRPDDADHLAGLRKDQVGHEARAAEAATDMAELRRQISFLALPAVDDPRASLDRIASLAESCRQSSHAADLATERHATLVRTLEANRAARGDDESSDILAGLHDVLDAADAGLAAYAAELATPAPEPGSSRRLMALILLCGGGLAAVAGALAGSASEALRLALVLGGVVAAGGGTFLLTSWARADALHQRRDALAQAADNATRSRDETSTRSEDLARNATASAEARRRLDTDLATLAAELAPWGLPAPATSNAADAALDELRGRLQRHGELTSRLERTRRDLERAEQEAAAAAARAADLLRRLDLPTDLDDMGPVRDLVDRQPAWLAASGSLRDAETALRRWRGEAEKQAAATGLSVADDADLESLLIAAAAEAAETPGLNQELGSLRQELRTAEAGHDLGVALAREQECREDLGAWCDGARDDLAEAALLDELRRQHEELAAPPRLSATNRLLDEFTRGRHTLVLTAADGAGFMAEDHRTGEVLRLDQLSDGTRAQVQLAVRVAFVSGTETGAAPPLFLDESLTTSDPHRLAAVAASLGRLAAATGRQVFYLTSQPGDVAAWRGALANADLPEPTILDLAAIRDLGAAATPDQLAPAAPATVPAPADLEPADYGRLLRVTALDPHRPWQEVDTFHLATPDRELIRRLRTAGLAAAGPLARALPRLGRTGVADVQRRKRLAMTLDSLRAFLTAWRTGRPRPVTIADVDASGAVTETFRPRVLELLAQHSWRAASFLAAVEAGDLPRFLARKQEILRDHLTEAGSLDEREPLDEDALVAEVLMRAAGGSQEEVRTSPQEVRTLVRRWLAAIPAGAMDRPPTRPSESDPTD